jgi:hypothetical protein
MFPTDAKLLKHAVPRTIAAREKARARRNGGFGQQDRASRMGAPDPRPEIQTEPHHGSLTGKRGEDA